MSIRTWQVGRCFGPRVLAVVVAALGFGLSLPASALASATEFLTRTEIPKGVVLPGVDNDSVARKQYVRVQTGVLDALKSTGGGKLRINLFEDYSVDVVLDRVRSRSATRYTLSGQIEGQPETLVVVARNKDAVVVNVTTPGGDLFQIRYRGKGISEVLQMVTGTRPLKLDPETSGKAALDAAPVSAKNGSAAKPLTGAVPKAEGDPDDGAFIDLLAVYTPAAAENNGGEEGMIAAIDAMVEETNWILVNSGVVPQVVAVYTTETSYSESGDVITDLMLLQGTDDDEMTSVHQQRDQFKADLVSLFVSQGNSCGIANQINYVPNPDEPDLNQEEKAKGQGFNVVVSPCNDPYNLAYQIGKNLGCADARTEEGDGVPGAFPFSFGHRLYVPDEDTTYTTVMSPDASSRIPYLSNPKVLFRGVPTGVEAGEPGEANNAATFQERAFFISTFRNEGNNSEPSIAEDSGGGITVETVVGQEPDSVLLTIANKGTGYMAYNVSTVADWVSVSPAAFKNDWLVPGSHEVSFNGISAFPPGIYTNRIIITSRTADNGPVEIPVKITVLRPCSYLITPVKAVFGHTGGNSALTISANSQDGPCNWNATSTADWITVLTPSGVGSASITYSVAPNPSPAFRTGTILVAGHTYTVSQTGAGGAQSGLKAVQKTAFRAAGEWYETLFYNYTTGAIGSTAPVNIPSSVPHLLPHDEWTGLFLYDYGEGRFTQATYSLKQAFP